MVLCIFDIFIKKKKKEKENSANNLFLFHVTKYHDLAFLKLLTEYTNF